MSHDPRERFTAAAGLYARHRPSYPAALYDWILGTAGVARGASALDLGCGTGISTRLLAERGLEVVGVDPNEEMLAQARRQGGARYLRGEATATGLPDASVDLVSVAQAFHWFDVPGTLRELARVLKPDQHAVAYWNVRDLSSSFMREYDDALRRYSSEYEILGRPQQTAEALRQAPGVLEPRAAEFGHAQRFDLEGLQGRAYSSSYVIHGVSDHAGFGRALAHAFDRYARHGAVEFSYRTLALLWRMGFP